jgi:hypothetical protein
VLANSVTVSSDDANPASGTTTVTVASVATSLEAAADPPATSAGNAVSLSASGLPDAATGTVAFASADGALCSGSVGSGVASCSASDPAAGTYAVTATYSGDATYAGSSADASFVVTLDPVLELSISGNPSSASPGSTYGLTLTASLAPTGGPAYADPTLTVTLPAGETFAAPPLPAGWSCSLSPDAGTLSCVSTAPTAIGAGAALGGVRPEIAVAASASGSLMLSAALADPADQATAASAGAPVRVGGVGVPGTGADPPAPWWPPALMLLAAGALLVGWSRRPTAAAVTGHPDVELVSR